MNTKHIINDNDVNFLPLKRSKKLLGYLWISPYFISKEGYNKCIKRIMRKLIILKYN